MATAGRLLEPGTRVDEYLHAHAQPRFGMGPVIGIAVFVVVFVVALALGWLLLPGGIFVVFLSWAVRPPRGVVVADKGVAVLSRSVVNGHPDGVVALVDYPTLATVPSEGRGSKVRMQLGPELMTFSRKEFRRFSEAVYGITSQQVSSARGPLPA